MSRINTNVASLIAQRVLAQNNNALDQSLQRLSTGLRINSGADDPAGLIASENLKADQAGITTALANANRASNIVGTAEGGIGEVSSLLTQLQSLVGNAASTGGTSPDEIQADQLQVDSILSTINRIAQGTSFQGKQLLNGDLAYTTSSVNSAQIDNVQVNSASVPSGGSVNVVVQVTASAQIAKLGYTGGAIAGGTVTIEVAGNSGSEQLSFASGTTVASVAASINTVKSDTGVSATVSGSDLRLQSTAFGSDQFVSVKPITGSFTVSGGTGGKDFGRDATVNVNGASAQASGLDVTYRSGNLDVSFDLNTAFNKAGTATFQVTGGGASFALGSKVTQTNMASMGIPSISTGSLGDSSNGFLDTLASGGVNSLNSSNLNTAQNIVDAAITQVSGLNGRLGAFQRFTLGSTINALGVAFENTSAAESNIVDTDFAQETANLTRAELLSAAATTVLAQANSTPQQTLQLLNH
jgi:flagellin